MFTGLIEETGRVLALERFSASPANSGDARLRIDAPLLAREVLQIGESVAVNGCCLTLVEQNQTSVAFDLLDETLSRTNLGALKNASPVNLERALAAGARLGGHFVQGHVDCAAPVLGFEKCGADFRLEISLPDEFARYVAFKGSIAINGISLTIAELREREKSFVCWIIPHTFSATNLRELKAGDAVNLEFDLLAKYVERMLAFSPRDERLKDR